MSGRRGVPSLGRVGGTMPSMDATDDLADGLASQGGTAAAFSQELGAPPIAMPWALLSDSESSTGLPDILDSSEDEGLAPEASAATSEHASSPITLSPLVLQATASSREPTTRTSASASRTPASDTDGYDGTDESEEEAERSRPCSAAVHSDAAITAMPSPVVWWLAWILALGLLPCPLAGLYEHPDSGSAFTWLHSIIEGMGVPTAVAASVLTLCGVRACSNSMLRDGYACMERWKGFLALLTDDITCALERVADIDDEPVDRDEVAAHLKTEIEHALSWSAENGPSAPRLRTQAQKEGVSPWIRGLQSSRAPYRASLPRCVEIRHGSGNPSLITCTCGQKGIREGGNFHSHLLGPKHCEGSEHGSFFARCSEIDQGSLGFAHEKLRVAEETILRLQASLEASVNLVEQQCAARLGKVVEQLQLQKNAASYYERVAWRECVPRALTASPQSSQASTLLFASVSSLFRPFVRIPSQTRYHTMQELLKRGAARELCDAAELTQLLGERGVLSEGVKKTKVRLWYESLRRMNSTAVVLGGKGLHLTKSTRAAWL